VISIVCQASTCQNKADTIISYTDEHENGTYATKILGSCNSCLNRFDGSEIGYTDIYRKCLDYKLLMSLKSLHINTYHVKCERSGCPENAKTAYAGIVKCSDNTAFYMIFYRCKDHRLEDSPTWRNLKIIELEKE
jgi:hypothetical protein